MNAIKTFVQKFAGDWTMNLAGMLTYSLITTIVPILLAILTVASIILGVISPGSFNQVVSSLQGVVGNGSSAINMSTLAHNVQKSTGILALVSIVGLFWGGSNLFTNVENAFSIIFRVRDRDFLPQRMMAIGMVIILAILLPLAFAASSLVTSGSKAFRSFLPGPLGILLTFVGPLVSIGILFALFLAIYIVVPNIKVPLRDAWRGAVGAAILFAIVTVIFPIYIKLVLGGNAKYGQILLTILVLIAWLWFFALITLIGAQINAVAMGLRPFPNDVARTLAIDYNKSLVDASRPLRRRRVPLPRRAQVSGVGRAAGAAFSLLGRLLAPVFRILALLGWLIARPLARNARPPSAGSGAPGAR